MSREHTQAVIGSLLLNVRPASTPIELSAHDIPVDVEYCVTAGDDVAQKVITSVRARGSIHLRDLAGDFELVIKPGVELAFILPERTMERIEEGLPVPE